MEPLPLDSPRWSELNHAYGLAVDIPDLIVALAGLPPDAESEAEPYWSLWSALCHQGDVYTASYAAVPHIVRAMEGDPGRAPEGLYLMLACIEIARVRGRGPMIPLDLESGYFEALGRIPELVPGAARGEWDHDRCGAVLAAVAASKGLTTYAEAIIELDPQTIGEMMARKFGGDDT